FWVVSRYQDVVSIAQKPESFSPAKEYDPATGKGKGGLAIPELPGLRAIPNECDPPEWNLYRTFLNRRFAPKAIDERKARARQFAAALVDRVIEQGHLDIVDDLASPLPALMMMDIFGFPLDDWRNFADPFHKMVYTPADDPAFLDTVKGLDYFKRRVDEEIAVRREHPSDDLLGYLAAGEIEGRPLTHGEIQDLAFNLMGGGIDTTTALTSNTLLWLARHPEQRRRLIDDPSLWPVAREEFLRFVTPIHGLARTVTQDTDMDGWAFREGERVLLAYSSANRDPEVFDNPDEVVLDRFPNRHIAFGAGMHRCLGSFLARMMYETMVTEVLARIPDYRIVEEAIEPYAAVARVNGWVRIPATFTPGQKVGGEIA
ncbi:MAG: cytochrome P450, partial [Sphingomonadales bacterium]